MAQQLFLTLGATQRGAGTPEAAREVHAPVAARAASAAPARGAVIDNGSGLSRDVAPQRRSCSAGCCSRPGPSPVMPELMSSLPVAGVDGTLRRSKGAPGRAHLKTGSLRDVVGVAGYVLADSGRRYVRRRHRQPPDAERGAAGARGAGASGRPTTPTAPLAPTGAGEPP